MLALSQPMKSCVYLDLSITITYVSYSLYDAQLVKEKYIEIYWRGKFWSYCISLVIFKLLKPISSFLNKKIVSWKFSKERLKWFFKKILKVDVWYFKGQMWHKYKNNFCHLEYLWTFSKTPYLIQISLPSLSKIIFQIITPTDEIYPIFHKRLQENSHSRAPVPQTVRTHLFSVESKSV